MAERWAEFIHETPEFDFIRRAVDQYGEPVLDLACGTGRLLLPLLRLGVDIDGCDLSADMLAKCRMGAITDDLEVDLYQQPMHELELPRRYGLIYICGSFGLGGSRDNDLETLKRCHAHLRDGGTLLLNIQAEYNSPQGWKIYLPEKRAALPQPWSGDGDPQVARDGSEHRAYFRTLEVDPLAQRFTRQVRLEKWRSGEMVSREEYTLKANDYLASEVRLLLNVAGFRKIILSGDYTEEPATADHDELIFIAGK
jgi:SAM-dependent methyltransferase